MMKEYQLLEIINCLINFIKMKLNKEFKIGLLVLVALVLFIWGFQFLKGKNMFSPGDKYYGVYSKLENLTEGSFIYYNGFKVGTVDKVQMHPSERGKFVVTFVITEKFFIPKNSIAEIYNSDLMGSKSIDLKEGDSNMPILPGDTISTSIKADIFDAVIGEFGPIKDKAEALITNLDSVLIGVSNIFKKENSHIIDDLIKSLHISATQLKGISLRIGDSFNDGGELSNSLENIEHLSQKFKDILDNIDEDDISSIISGLDSTMTMIQTSMKEIEEANGTIGKLINDEELYQNLTDAAENLDKLLEDVRINPKKYVSFSAFDFGKKVYLVTSEEIAKEKEITFKVNLKTTNTSDNLANSKVENYNVEEFVLKNKFLYIIGESNSYLEMENLKNKIIENFPTAEILAFEKGKNIKLEKALKTINYRE